MKTVFLESNEVSYILNTAFCFMNMLWKAKRAWENSMEPIGRIVFWAELYASLTRYHLPYVSF